LALGGGICVAKDLKSDLVMIDTQLGEDEEYRDNMLGNPKRFVKTLKTTLGKLQNRVCVATFFAALPGQSFSTETDSYVLTRMGRCSWEASATMWRPFSTFFAGRIQGL
jgi:hypothetical protein